MRERPFVARQEPFTCLRCGSSVFPLKHGTYRNHCPHCLHSRHVDERGPGDRSSRCGGLMVPLAISPDPRKEWIITHQCDICGKSIRNRAAPDDNVVEVVSHMPPGELKQK